MLCLFLVWAISAGHTLYPALSAPQETRASAIWRGGKLEKWGKKRLAEGESFRQNRSPFLFGIPSRILLRSSKHSPLPHCRCQKHRKIPFSEEAGSKGEDWFKGQVLGAAVSSHPCPSVCVRLNQAKQQEVEGWGGAFWQRGLLSSTKGRSKVGFADLGSFRHTHRHFESNSSFY